MKLKKLQPVLLSVILLFSLGSNAGLITDTTNDSFIDEATGLEWMDFGINNVYTFNEVVAKLGVGEEYEGWRVATQDEVYNLLAVSFLSLDPHTSDIDLSTSYVFLEDGIDVQGSVFTETFAMMGQNYEQGTGSDYERFSSVGLYGDGLSQLEIFQNIGAILDIQDQDYMKAKHGTQDFRNSTLSVISTMLVRNTTNVPEPTTLAIFALGIIGLGLHRKNQD